MKNKLIVALLVIIVATTISPIYNYDTYSAPIKNVYAHFIISDGLETAQGPVIQEGISGVGWWQYGTDTASIVNESGLISTPASAATNSFVIYYQAVEGYQNAQCTADGVPKANGESIAFSLSESSPTQIICTAEPIPEPEPEPEPITASTAFNVNLAETIEFSNLPTSVELSITPSPNGTFKSSSLDITLGSNYRNGYSLFMNTDSTDLTNSSATATLPTLPTTASDYSLDDFTVNHWGYSTNSTIFHPVFASQLLDSVSTPINSRTSTVHLGAKVDIAQPNGSYAGHIIFVAIPNIITE